MIFGDFTIFKMADPPIVNFRGPIIMFSVTYDVLFAANVP